MTALNLSTDIPSSINTVEKLIVWSNALMSELYQETLVVEAVNVQERVFQYSPFLVTAVDPSIWRVINRSSIELDKNWRRQGKIWTYAKEVGTIPIPTDFKS